MPHPDEPALVSYVAEHSSGVALAVYGASDPVAARAALHSAAARIGQIRHPDQPDQALPNLCVVRDEDGVPVLHLDMKDEIRYAALVVRIVLDQLSSAGVHGRLQPKRRPPAAYEYDANADLYGGMELLAELDERGLPPGFPAGFPVPDEATLVMAERWRDGNAEHAAWRRSTGPFTGYLQRLRAYGCTFGAVPRLLTAGSVPGGMVRYLIWRDGAGGSVTLYRHEPRKPRSPLYWYVSVVWQPHTEPPATPVEPDEAPDTRPVPTGPAAARELAQFLVPAQLVAGYETVIALGTAAHALGRLVSAPPDPADPTGPFVVARRLAPVLAPLPSSQLSLLRHVCWTMVENLMASGRRPRPAGLTLTSDQDGRLYAADLRQRAQEAMPADLVPFFETGMALIRGAPMLADAVSGIPHAPARPPADRYAWLFNGLPPQHLAAAQEGCWRILGT